MSIKETLPFNFDDIYSYIETKFANKGYDIEEGSNTMQLVTAMSYLVSMLNANTATNINETLLTLSRKRGTTLQDARVLGYEITHVQSYQYELTLRFENAGTTDVTKTIKKYTSFTSGAYTYYYMGNNVDIVIPASSVYTDEENDTSIYKTIIVKEGTLNLFSDYPTALSLVIEDIYDAKNDTWSTQHYVDIPFTNVEDNGIEVFLTYYDEEATYFEQEEWKKSSQFMIDKDTVLNKEFVRLDLIDYKTPRLYFKLGDVGQELRTGTIVEMNIIISSGTEGAMIDTPVPTALDATVTNYLLKIQGATEESLASIKKNAPLFHNSANRAVTKPDYIAFSNRQPAVRYTDIWDGQNEYPHKPGHVWFSFVPSTNIRSLLDETETTVGAGDGAGKQWDLQKVGDIVNWYIEDAEIENNTDGVWDILRNYKIPTLIYHHRHPIYFDFLYEVKIARYTVKTSEADINLGVFNVINDYFRDETEDTNKNDLDTESVENFGYEYFQSNLVKRIDSELTDIMGFDLFLITTINICDKNIIQEELVDETNYYKEIRFHLGVPFEGIFDENGVIFENIPDITTENFISTDTLMVDENSVTQTIIDSEFIIYTCDILSGTDIIGKINFFDGRVEDIEVILYVYDPIGYTVGINPTLLDTTSILENEEPGLKINIKYPSTNIRFARNTIPRLKQVKFL